jgi:fructose-1,6-bisphosphatase II
LELGEQLSQDLVQGEDCFFACTGITPGQLVAGVTFDAHGAVTDSVVMRSKSGTVRQIRARHSFSKLRRYASVAY